MLKTNSKKILTWIYSKGEKVVFLDRKNVNRIVGNLSQAGQRALLYHLVSQELIAEQRLGSELGYYITERGRRTIEEEMLVLSPQWAAWNGSWLLIGMLEAPKFDKNFQNLRRRLVEGGALPLGRGMYLWPSCLLVEAEKLLNKKYSSFVWLFRVEEILNDKAGKTIAEKLDLQAWVEDYSGISRDISKLLGKRRAKKRLTDREIVEIYKLYDRLFFVGERERGLISYSLKRLEKATNKSFGFEFLLGQLQDLIS